MTASRRGLPGSSQPLLAVRSLNGHARCDKLRIRARLRIAMPPRHRNAGFERVSLYTAEGLLAAALFFCPLALGTFQPWSVGAMLTLSCLALLSAPAGPRGAPLPINAMGVGLFAVALYVGLQCQPLPGGLLHLLSPQGAETYAFSLAGLPSAVRWHPITLDGPATSRELAKALAYACAFGSAYALAGSRRTRRRLAGALALAGFAIALLGYGHLLFNSDRLFGQPIFKEATSPFVTTFGNKNHAGGFLSLCAPVALGLALRDRHRRRQALWALVYLLTGAAVFLTGSRGAICSFWLPNSLSQPCYGSSENVRSTEITLGAGRRELRGLPSAPPRRWWRLPPTSPTNRSRIDSPPSTRSRRSKATPRSSASVNHFPCSRTSRSPASAEGLSHRRGTLPDGGGHRRIHRR